MVETETLELSIDDAADAFLKDLEDDDEDIDVGETSDDSEVDEDDIADEEVDEDDIADEDDTDEDAESESDDDADGTDTDGDASEPLVAPEDAVVDVVVDGKTTRMKVADLTRLAGQEASLTQKSQSVAERERINENQGLFVANILQKRYDAAKANAEKYAKVDLFRASRELEADEFDALRSAKEAADLELNTIEREAQTFMQVTQEQRSKALRAKAQNALQVLPKMIPEWSDNLYGEIRQYAVAQGMDKQAVNEIVEPAAIMLLHKAMQFDRAQTKKETVKKKVVKTPAKTTRKSTTIVDAKASKLKAKRTAAARSGSVDDVAALFEAQLNS